MIDYCCQRFEGLLSLGDDRGMSMIIKRNVKFGDFYFVRFRAVARDDDDRLGSADVPVAKVIEQAIQHCPWCGTNLAATYGPFVDDLPHVIDNDGI